MAEEYPTHYLRSSVRNSINWRVYIQCGVVAFALGLTLGSLAILVLWVLSLPAYFLTDFGLGMYGVHGAWLSNNWPLFLVWYSLTTAVIGSWYGVREYDRRLVLDLQTRQIDYEKQRRPNTLFPIVLREHNSNRSSLFDEY